MPDPDLSVPVPPTVASAGKRLTSWRSAHRSRSHESAHAEEDRPAAALDHPLVPAGNARLIVDQPALETLLGELRAAGTFAYDTEFIGELTYHPNLCLIQVATTRMVALVDPMAMLELRGLWELFADPGVEKIVHAGQQDVEPIARHLNGRGAQNVVDTQIAAGFCGMAYPVSLAKLVLEVMGIKLGKGLTFSHWDQRPLSAVQLRYAADDVRYLPAIWDLQKRTLIAAGHLDWANAEFDAVCDPSLFGFKPDVAYLKIRGATSLSMAGQSVLRALTIWRDAAARAVDAPARALLKDDVLIELARSPIKEVDRLSRVRGLPRPIEAEYGQKIVETTIKALESPLPNTGAAKSVEASPTERFRAESLFTAACAICVLQGIDPGLLINRQDVLDLHRRHLDDQNVYDLPVMTGWRREALGEPLLSLLKGERTVTLTWQNEQLSDEGSPARRTEIRPSSA